MRTPILILLTCFSLLVKGQQINTNQSDALQLMKIENYIEAEKLWNQILTQNPNNLEALQQRAVCYLKSNRFEESKIDLLSMLKFAKTADLYGQLGYVCIEMNQIKEARDYLERSIAMDSTDVIYMYNLGLTHQIEGEYAQAITFFNRVLRQKPDTDRAIVSKARCLNYLDLNEQANELVNAFFTSGKFDADMLCIRGDLKLKENLYEEAVADYTRSTLTLPLDLYYLKKTAFCLEQLSRFQEEISIRKEIIDLVKTTINTSEDISEAYLRLGFAFLQNENFSEAESNFNTSIEVIPTNGQVYFYRSIARVELRNLEGACIDLNQAKKLQPDQAIKFDLFFADDESYEEFVDYCNPNP